MDTAGLVIIRPYKLPTPADTTTVSYFTDKLSAETRVLIYGYVFGPSAHVKRLEQEELPADAKKDERVIFFHQPTKAEEVLAPTSIFSTNKLVSAEAMETFYNTEHLRMTFIQVVNDAKD